MRKLLWACVVLAACDSGAVQPRRTSSAEAMKKMQGFKDQMCECKDSTCAQRVSDAMTQWGKAQLKEQPYQHVMTEEDAKKFTQIGEAMATCMQNAMATPGKYPSQGGG